MRYYFILTAFCCAACDFGSTNVDPGNLTDASLSLMLPGAEMQAAYNIGALGGRMPGIVMQHWAGNDAQQLAYTSYNIGESDMNNLWNAGLYGGVMKDAKIMIEKAQQEGNAYYVGIGKVLMAHALGVCTSMWGDIPYSQALDIDQYPKPVFDAQADVYDAIQTLLSEAIVEFSKPAYVAPVPPGGDDLYFGGNASAWIKVAHSLKARYYLHLTKRDAASAQNALDEIAAGAIAGNDDEPVCPFASAQNNANPYYLFGIQRPNTMVMAPSFVDRLTANADPRKNKLVHSNNVSYFNASNDNLFWVQADAGLPLISYSEIKFIEAEALLRTGDAPGAEAALALAIEANMERLGVDGTAYVAARGNFTGLTTDEERLQRIIEEKYVSMYAQAETEVWADYRRTGYPAIAPTPNGTAGGLNPGGLVPRRFLYPINERTTNEDNYNAAVQNQGGNLMNVDLWAFN